MTFLSTTLDVTALLALALAATMALRHRSAALRHSLLAWGVAVATTAPLLELLIPQWPLPVIGSWNAPQYATSGLRFAADSMALSAASGIASTPAHAVEGISWLRTLVILWAAGALLCAAVVAIGFVRLMLVASRAVRLASGPWVSAADDLAKAYNLRFPVAILQSASPALLVTWGHWRPRIVLPAGAANWPLERIRSVIAHELAHISRGDWAVQICAEALRALYWFNPLVWIACRRLRHESEYACDDAVLRSGVAPATYAIHLLDVARQFAGSHRLWHPAPAVARPSTLERRISAMFNEKRDRQPLTPRTSLLAALAMVVAALPIAAFGISSPAADAMPVVQPDIMLVGPQPMPGDVLPKGPRARSVLAPGAQAGVASVSGTLYDQLGGLLPGVAIRLTDAASGAEYSTTTEREATFAFENLTPGKYRLVALLPGFRSVTIAFSLAAGEQLSRIITLPMGGLQETVSVNCAAATAAAAPTRATTPATSGRGAAPTSPVSSGRGAVQAGGNGMPFSGVIGGQIAVPRRITSAAPRCPNFAVTTSTVVILEGRIGIDGYVNDIRVLRPSNTAATTIEPEFVESATEAVQRWVFTPTLLNNTPVEVIVTVTVMFAP